MKGFCNRCGDCCNPIKTSWSPEEIAVKLGTKEIDENGSRDFTFIANHWSCISRDEDDRTYDYQCNKFNRVTRMCEAYDERPPICSDFPYYGKEPEDGRSFEKNCSFWWDVKDRPAWARPLLPIVALDVSSQARTPEHDS